jgi:hypothetical protein
VGITFGRPARPEVMPHPEPTPEHAERHPVRPAPQREYDGPER